MKSIKSLFGVGLKESKCGSVQFNTTEVRNSWILLSCYLPQLYNNFKIHFHNLAMTFGKRSKQTWPMSFIMNFQGPKCNAETKCFITLLMRKTVTKTIHPKFGTQRTAR